MFQGSFGTCPSGTCGDTNCSVQSKKRNLKREFEHDSIARHKINVPGDLQVVWDDDSSCYIVCDIVCDIVYDITLHIVYDIVHIYDIVYKDAISYTI